MAINVKSTKDVHTNGIKCVLYGASGSGKTRMAAAAPNPIIISAEKGLLSLADFDLPYIEVQTLKTLDEAYKHVYKSEYETIIIDSLSEVTQVILDQTKKRMVSESQSGKIDARQAYGKIAEDVGNMIRNFRDMDGKNVIFIAKERKMEGDDGGITYEAYLPGQVLPFDLPYLVDEVFCLQINKAGQRFLQTESDFKRVCKDRSGKLGNPEQPDFNVIYPKIRGEK